MNTEYFYAGGVKKNCLLDKTETEFTFRSTSKTLKSRTKLYLIEKQT